MSTSTSNSGIGIAAGVVGAIVTVVLYWIDLWWLGGGNAQFIDQSGAWIVIIISTFVTGYIAATIGN